MLLDVNIKTRQKQLYFLADNIVSKSTYEKDLGVLVNSKLPRHDQIANKVNRVTVHCLIRRTCGTYANADVIKGNLSP